MTRMMRTVNGLGVLAVGVLGCGGGTASDGNPLEGTWIRTMGTVSVSMIEVVALNSDGTVTTSLTDSLCTGTITYSGQRWTSNATTLSILGTSTCSGTSTCGATSESCGGETDSLVPSGTYPYVLGNENDALLLTNAIGGFEVFARQ